MTKRGAIDQAVAAVTALAAVAYADERVPVTGKDWSARQQRIENEALRAMALMEDLVTLATGRSISGLEYQPEDWSTSELLLAEQAATALLELNSATAVALPEAPPTTEIEKTMRSRTMKAIAAKFLIAHRRLSRENAAA